MDMHAQRSIRSLGARSHLALHGKPVCLEADGKRPSRTANEADELYGEIGGKGHITRCLSFHFLFSIPD